MEIVYKAMLQNEKGQLTSTTVDNAAMKIYRPNKHWQYGKIRGSGLFCYTCEYFARRDNDQRDFLWIFEAEAESTTMISYAADWGNIREMREFWKTLNWNTGKSGFSFDFAFSMTSGVIVAPRIRLIRPLLYNQGRDWIEPDKNRLDQIGWKGE